MADYGFKVMRENSKKTTGAGVVLNAKNPMLGFALGKKPATYFTVHISDTSTNSFADNSTEGYVEPTVPTGSDLVTMTSPNYTPMNGVDIVSVSENRSLCGANKVSGMGRELIYERKHGLGYKPAWYSIFSGDLKLSITCRNIGIPQAGTYNFSRRGGGYSISDPWARMAAFDTTTNTSYSYLKNSPSMGVLDAGMIMADYISAYSIPTASNDDAWYVQYAVSMNIPRMAEEEFDGWGPYVVEVDEEYVRIYRQYLWLEAYGRVYRRYTTYGTVSGTGYDSDWHMDARLRQKMVSQTTGTELDITIMLMPYSLEDL